MLHVFFSCSRNRVELRYNVGVSESSERSGSGNQMYVVVTEMETGVFVCHISVCVCVFSVHPKGEHTQRHRELCGIFHAVGAGSTQASMNVRMS